MVRIDLLGRFHIYTLLDMHDVYNELFDGEGAPNWAVCTGETSNAEPPAGGRRTPDRRRERPTATSGRTTSSVTFKVSAATGCGPPWRPISGGIPGSLATTRSTSRSRHRWSHRVTRSSTASWNASTQAGRSSVPPPTAHRRSCAPRVCRRSASSRLSKRPIRVLLCIDPTSQQPRLPRTSSVPCHSPTWSSTCTSTADSESGKTGNPTDIAACGQEQRSLHGRASRTAPTSAPIAQPSGPAWFLSEFGATSIGRCSIGSPPRPTGAWSAGPTGPGNSMRTRRGAPRGSSRRTDRSDRQRRCTTHARIPKRFLEGRRRCPSIRPAGHFTWPTDHAVRIPTAIFVPTQVHYPAGTVPGFRAER